MYQLLLLATPRPRWKAAASALFALFIVNALPVSLAANHTSPPASAGADVPRRAPRSAVHALAADAAAVSITYVTSAPRSTTLVWWAIFLISVGALGVLVAIALPIYHVYRGRAFRAEEAARGAEIHKSMQEMTTRLYRTRQQQEQYRLGLPSGAGASGATTPTAPAAQLFAIDAEERGVKRSGSGSSYSGPDAMVLSESTTPFDSAAATVTPTHHHRPQQPHRANGGSGGRPASSAAVARVQAGDVASANSDVAMSAPPSYSRRAPAPPPAAAATDPLARNTSTHALLTTSLSSASLRRHPSAATLAARTASSRVTPTAASPGPLPSIPSVRAFAGMSKVEALRRALSSRHLQPVASFRHTAASPAIPSLVTANSTTVVSSNAAPASRMPNPTHSSPEESYAKAGHVPTAPRPQAADRHDSRGNEEASVPARLAARAKDDTVAGGGTTLQPPAPTNITDTGAPATAAPAPSAPAASWLVKAASDGASPKTRARASPTERCSSSAAHSDSDAELATEMEEDGEATDEGTGRRRTFDRMAQEMQRLIHLDPGSLTDMPEGAAVLQPSPSFHATSEEMIGSPSTAAGVLAPAEPTQRARETDDVAHEDREAPHVPHEDNAVVRRPPIVTSDADADATPPSARFVLARSRPSSGTRVEGRPMVSRQNSTEDAHQDGDSDDDGPGSRISETDAQGHLTRQLRLHSRHPPGSAVQQPLARTTPSSTSHPPAPPPQHPTFFSTMNDSDEYWRLTDAQFQKRLR